MANSAMVRCSITYMYDIHFVYMSNIRDYKGLPIHSGSYVIDARARLHPNAYSCNLSKHSE